MNIFFIAQSIALILVVVFAARYHYSSTKVISDFTERLQYLTEKLQSSMSNIDQIKKSYELMTVELLKTQDKLGVLQREVYRKSKPKEKSKTTTKKTTKKAPKEKAPDITVDAIEKGK